MNDSGRLTHETEALRDRMTGLSAATLRISESLEFETLCRGAAQPPGLTGSKYGVLTKLGESDRPAGDLPVRLRPEPDHRAGPSGGRR